MTDYSITLPSYTVGVEAYDTISGICRKSGRQAVIIGGRRALEAAEAKIRAGMGTDIFAPPALQYGGEASEENITALAAAEEVREADMIFAVGGGKALDTCKALAQQMDKPVFAFPTIASTCAATTAVSILYHPDGSFSRPYFLKRPPVHTFIDTSVLAAAPARYMWAGMGDTYAKYYESTVSARGETLPHYHALGIATARMCVDPVLCWGAEALAANRDGQATDPFEQVALAIIVTTGIASILLTAEHTIDYNTGLAHAVFYALTTYPHIEKNHLHGEVVGFGVLLLLLADGQKDAFTAMHRFMKTVGLPTSPEEIQLTKEEMLDVIPKVCAMPDIAHNPYPISVQLLTDAFEKLEKYNTTDNI
ncbi:MAG: iron-containing alcohol dehydrogenase family protein [Clostridiales bacterium]|jgi:glycerol dehydrogenase-like iron-containing ADH family enzyme|nr:iron-containing alcohol dehydrogenase family protein [Clostridiales bacterium]